MTPFGSLQHPTTLILGLGVSGLSMARWCARHHCRLYVADTRAAPKNLPALEGLKAQGHSIDYIPGPFNPALLRNDVELIALSPGISPYSAELAPLLKEAQARKMPVWGELEFFAQALRHAPFSGPRPGTPSRVVAITGTNGKTTTTALTGLLCQCTGQRVGIAGNIGKALLDALSESIDANQLPDFWVLELSSFQLESSHTFAPDVATILNTTPDHLDWHGSFKAYMAAKHRIFGPHTCRVRNRNEVHSMTYSSDTAIDTAAIKGPPHFTFGLDTPCMPGDTGLIHEDGIDWLVLAEPAAPAHALIQPPPGQTSNSRAPASRNVKENPKIYLNRLMPASALQIRGQHNVANALAAITLCRALDLPLAPLQRGLKNYYGEPHRVQTIASLNQVDFIDDSKGTNVGATVAALNSLYHSGHRIVLILGGEGKGQDFSALIAPVTQSCRAVFLIGQDAPVLEAVLHHTEVPLHLHASLEAATYAAAALAQANDVVLLSPACASFDMFKDYRHRAAIFHETVQRILAASSSVAIHKEAI